MSAGRCQHTEEAGAELLMRVRAGGPGVVNTVPACTGAKQAGCGAWEQSYFHKRS